MNWSHVITERITYRRNFITFHNTPHLLPNTKWMHNRGIEEPPQSPSPVCKSKTVKWCLCDLCSQSLVLPFQLQHLTSLSRVLRWVCSFPGTCGLGYLWAAVSQPAAPIREEQARGHHLFIQHGPDGVWGWASPVWSSVPVIHLIEAGLTGFLLDASPSWTWTGVPCVLSWSVLEPEEWNSTILFLTLLLSHFRIWDRPQRESLPGWILLFAHLTMFVVSTQNSDTFLINLLSSGVCVFSLVRLSPVSSWSCFHWYYWLHLMTAATSGCALQTIFENPNVFISTWTERNGGPVWGQRPETHPRNHNRSSQISIFLCQPLGVVWFLHIMYL